MKACGTLYGVGVGPGDPKLMTLAAVETIGRCPVVALPDSGRGEPVALKIAGEYAAGKALLHLSMPMSHDREMVARQHEAAVDRVAACLEEGQDVAFLTLGDPSVYSTFLYLHRMIKGWGYRSVLVPGVPSFCAAAALTGEGLCEGGQALHILPGSYDGVEEALALDGVKVVMKSGKQAGKVLAALRERDMTDRSVLVENCGMAGERVVDRPLPEEAPGYFATIIVKEQRI